jgi:tryptophan 2,3-dioxygenase
MAEPQGDAARRREARYRLGGMGYQSEPGRRLDYASYLHLEPLLTLQGGLTQAHDELLFIVIHQVYELWFKVIVHELEAAIRWMDADDLPRARHALHRVTVIERLLVEQVEVLETMAPQDFLTFRSELAPASGFQSVQFREVEFLSGLRHESVLRHLEISEADRARLERRLHERSLWDGFQEVLVGHGQTDLTRLYRERDRYPDVVDLAEALLDHDEGFSLWRSRHIHMVERQIGHKKGTGGSMGVEYLRSTLDKRFFPQLWEVRSDL